MLPPLTATHSALPTDSREDIVERLLTTTHPSPNQPWLAKIIASWLTGNSVLPDFIGLEPEQFKALCQFYFADADISTKAVSGIVPDYRRMPEIDDLIQLLQAYSRTRDQENDWIISIIVIACMGLDHLWEDLGLWQRSELSALISYNFPQLAESNSKNMKWKKFIYKKLCDAEGIYLCRAPSCEVCTDYAKCFGPED
ncbi:nitrogen fixation protein NifQ [Methylophaga sp.]|uniref:nitrogen fixation protein NifQ n=1 Tax=Methylophaga sp. TaxID=2024840 RepID=UPI00271E1898|nr:nitrogen fixation protein NifQ [Methylophaga sp.]MDO8828059.1 nitrogen fixation protein NifQ [Methylophaga sp.]